MSLVGKESIHFHYIRMIKKGLYLYLSNELNGKTAINLGLLNLLQGTEEASSFMPKYLSFYLAR